jgi:hypothetical protein
MTSKNIGYHTRLYADNTVKVVGGSFGGSIDPDTVARLVKSHFTVVVKPSGTCVFVDKQGREVNLYLSVDARETDAGKAALKAHHAQQRALWDKAQADEQQASEEIENLMDGLSHEEIVRRLKNK